MLLVLLNILKDRTYFFHKFVFEARQALLCSTGLINQLDYFVLGSNLTTYIGSILLGSTVLLNMVEGCFSGLCCKWLLFAITPSHSASTVESHRYFVESVASSLAFATSGLVFTHLFLVMPFFIMLCLAILFSLLVIQNDIFREIRKNEKSDTRSHTEGPNKIV